MRWIPAIAAILLFVFPWDGIAQEKGDEFSFVGSKNCRKCHIRQYKSWAKTRMAQSFELLKPGVAKEAKSKAGLDPAADYTKDPKCLACHTTGYGKKGGFASIEATPDLAGVGCESCHGPGGEYLKPEHMSLKNKEYKRAELTKIGLISPVTRETCESLCHNSNSPFFDPKSPFDFEKRKTEGTHVHVPLKYKHE